MTNSDSGQADSTPLDRQGGDLREEPSNKRMQLTRPAAAAASQLIRSVRPLFAGEA